jgi:hypothetical protein
VRVYCFNLNSRRIRHQFPGIIFRQQLEILPLQLPLSLISRLAFILFKKWGKEITKGAHHIADNASAASYYYYYVVQLLVSAPR